MPPVEVDRVLETVVCAHDEGVLGLTAEDADAVADRAGNASALGARTGVPGALFVRRVVCSNRGRRSSGSS